MWRFRRLDTSDVKNTQDSTKVGSRFVRNVSGKVSACRLQGVTCSRMAFDINAQVFASESDIFQALCDQWLDGDRHEISDQMIASPSDIFPYVI